MDTQTKRTVKSGDAIHYLTGYEFYSRIPRIVEHNTGIDAGRSYDHEKQVTYPDFMWSVLNHIAHDGVSGITTDIVDVQNGNTTTQMLWFHLYDDDPESYGLHYEFIYI